MKTSNVSYLSLIHFPSLRGILHKIFWAEFWQCWKHGKSNERGLPALWETMLPTLLLPLVREDFIINGCVDHTLQLAISDSLKGDAVSDLLKLVRAIVGHFNPSSVARHLLDSVQSQLQLPKHQLMKECTTRSNSMYYMLERLLEQRWAIATILPETNCSVELTLRQWTLVGHLVELLCPFEEFSREFECADACLSLVLPAIWLLHRHVSKPLGGENEVSKDIRKELEKSLSDRFCGMKTWELHSMATLLYPRIKTKGSSTALFAGMAT